MSSGLPFSRPYNLNRRRSVGDVVDFSATDEEKAALAGFVDVLRVENLFGRIALQNVSPNRFQLEFSLAADIVQACVVSLTDVASHIERNFARDLHFSPPLRRSKDLTDPPEVSLQDDAPEEIESLNYDLAGPLIEELVLAIEPYPRAPGVEFQPPAEGQEAPQNPFAVLKGLKSGL